MLRGFDAFDAVPRLKTTVFSFPARVEKIPRCNAELKVGGWYQDAVFGPNDVLEQCPRAKAGSKPADRPVSDI